MHVRIVLAVTKTTLRHAASSEEGAYLVLGRLLGYGLLRRHP